MSIRFLRLFTIVFLAACNPRADKEADVPRELDSLEIIRNIEAREDSLELARAMEAKASFSITLTADAETEPVESAEGEDAADDPAIWYNHLVPERSLVLGTNKKGGLYVYDLEGRMMQFKPVGMINNVDLRDGFQLNGEEVVLVAGSNRSNNSITLFTIDQEKAELSDSLMNIYSGVDEVYGICLYRDARSDALYVFVNGKGGMVEQWLIEGMNGLGAKLLRQFSVNSQPEGMVVDDERGILYLGVEQEGIYKLDARPGSDIHMVKLEGSDAGNPNIVYDIEGLALFDFQGNNYLIASSQGNFSYAIFRTGEEEHYVTSFVISEGLMDGVEETDGLDISTAYLNEKYPEGILVVQDGFNTLGDDNQNQNFKYLSFEKIGAILSDR